MKRTAMIAGVVLVALVLAIAATAYAANNDSGLVNVTASAKSRLQMTLGGSNPVAFGAQDPGSTVTQAGAVTVQVKSNMPFTTSQTIVDGTNPNGPMGLTVGGNAGAFPVTAVPIAAGTHAYSDDYSINIPWTAAVGAPLAATVTYSATQ